jgi:adenylate cyclase
MATLRQRAARLLEIADLAGDDDETRLRKHVGVAAGYATILAPLGVPVLVQGALVGWILAVALSISSIANVALLARSKRFERYVYFLIGCGPVFVIAINSLSGGVTSASGSLVWAFLVPAYALLALGPRRAKPWFFVFVATVVAAILIDPWARAIFPAPPYEVQLVFYVQNLVLPLAITFGLLRYTDLRRREAERRSDELLTNAIPPAIAARLLHGEDRIAESYPETTVIFADIAGFTPWSQGLPPSRVVALLDDLFTRFDRRAIEIGVEKIKMIGDAYMAVAGAPTPNADHARDALAFGRAMLEEVAEWRSANGLDLQIRVGMASGPVIGGCIGRRRMLFDLWGATVNTASRMESSGVPGRIQITDSTRELLADAAAEAGFEPTEARDLEVKGLGRMRTYLLAGERAGA